MFYSYAAFFFLLGTIFGSFYNVVGYRLPNGMSLIKPPSHCVRCNHRLNWYELIPILSFLIQGGKCRNCKTKISPIYAIFEALTGLLFLMSYVVFGLSLELIVALIFVSTIVIIIISDLRYMVISDEVLIFSSIAIIIAKLFIYGTDIYKVLIGALLSMACIYSLKLIGDFVFKKESLGGGDVKYMFLIGLVLEFPVSITVIFLSSFIAIPVGIVTLIIKKDNILAFGPYLSIGALILYFLQVTPKVLLDFLTF